MNGLNKVAKYLNYISEHPTHSCRLASAKHSDPILLGSDALRRIYPDHSIVISISGVNILAFPEIAAIPVERTPLITNTVFIPVARVSWKTYDFLLFVVQLNSFPLGLVVQSLAISFTKVRIQPPMRQLDTPLIHQIGSEEPSRQLLLAVGGWFTQLHDEIWVYNEGSWQKDHNLWLDVQKGDWKDVILNDNFKKALQKDVYGFFTSEKVYKDLGIPWKRGLIMYGPPGKFRVGFSSSADCLTLFIGNGKTISIKVIMKTCQDQGFLPLYVKSLQSWKGEERSMTEIFDHARQLSPCVLIFEDLDSLINDKNRSFFLNQLDGMTGNDGLLVIGTTNHFDRLDPGLSNRPSRKFDDPDLEGRTIYVKYWQNKLKNNKEISFTDKLVNEIAAETKKFSFAYLKEAFVSSLVELARDDGNDSEKYTFEHIIKNYIKVLREELGTSLHSTATVRNGEETASQNLSGKPGAKAQEAAKSPKSAAALKDIIESYPAVSSGSLSEKQATLTVALAGALAKASIGVSERDYLIFAILNDRLKSVDQVNAAVKFAETNNAPFNDAAFDKECGVGFSISSVELDNQVRSYITSNTVAGWASLGAVISALKATPELRWANPVDVKNSVETVFKEVFGPKEASKPKGKEPKQETGKAAPKGKAADEAASDAAVTRKSVFEEGFLGSLHKPGENPQANPRHREAHLAATNGNVWTRFPPEPNGYLHIGHSKAIFVNFGYAAHHNGKCYLRYDDTNPEKEEAKYFESILEVVRWLGFEPWKITYSSDYFDELYDLAVELIKRDKAYVCHCTQEEIKVDRGEKRGQPRPCIHRNRPIAESLTEFEAMKNGKYRPKEANLRMKQDLEDGNPQMWDLTAYRVLDSPHHRTHDKWKIYPTYDFTHCLVDSFENISHSLCTTEFIASRQSYEWLCDAVDVYRPRQSEYGRLNLEGTIMSKRKIHALVTGGYVNGWDDPRLYTLIALRRRGVPPGAIISFVSTLGVSTAASNIEISRFEQTVRQYLENTAPRLLMVTKPLKVTIENLPEDHVSTIEKPLHPKVPELGTSTVPFTRNLYIEADDFRLEDSKDYFRLAPGKTVGLFGAAHPITYVSHKTDSSTGEVVEVIVKLENDGTAKKPKAFIQWVAEHKPSGSPVRVDETRIFHRLFKSDRPSGDVSDLQPNSLEVVKGALIEVGFWALAKRSFIEARREAAARTEKAAKENETTEVAPGDDTPHATSEQLVGKECVRFQGLRVGYFALDKDARLACLDEPDAAKPSRNQGDYLVLNRIVSLKEDSGKGV
ncbi:hypothetical protein H0H92_010983 [Tricholoma furcatifolium]|nr:hypothetical protein H0H92_010983 [Tricholoma furcatifolium]